MDDTPALQEGRGRRPSQVLVANPNGSGNNRGTTIRTNGSWTRPSVSRSTG